MDAKTLSSTAKTIPAEEQAGILEPFVRWGGGVRASAPFTAWEVAKLYDFPSDLDGRGQKIAIVALAGGYRQADLETYFGRAGKPVPVVRWVSVDGATNAPTGDYRGPDAEICLSLQVAGSVAPGAELVVYFAPNTVQGFYNAVARAVADRPCAVSISWGMSEGYWSSSALKSFDALFAKAISLKIAVLCASGDYGSSDGIQDGNNHVNFPSSSPNVTACGGTTLATTDYTQTTFLAETAWRGGGGGASAFFARPSYQKIVAPSLNRRRTPDLCGNADPYTGFQVVVDGVNATYGGTSAVTPLVAGLVALVCQSNNGSPCGFLNPTLYANGPALCRDVLQGSNGAFVASSGYDLTTGWGSPKGSAWPSIFKTLRGAPVVASDSNAQHPPVWLQRRRHANLATNKLE